MSNHISIRVANAQDSTTIAAFNCAMALETENKLLDVSQVEAGVAGMLAEPAHGFYLLASKDDTVKACLMVTYEWSDWRNGMFWWIQSVYVSPDARRLGLFSALYKEVKKRASQSNSCGIRLYVEKDNQRAQNTYATLGMDQCDYLMYEEEFKS